MPGLTSVHDEGVRTLASALVAAGLRHAFGVTGGGRSLDFITALEDAGATYLPVSHEASATIMAGAVSSVTGAPAVSVTVKGPGLANALPGIVHNFFEGRPAFTVAEAYGTQEAPLRMHKRLDHARLVAPFVKAHAGLPRTPDEVTNLVALARAESPGPIHVDLADVQAAGRVPLPARPAAENARIQTLVRSARHPVVVVGSLGHRRALGKRLATLRIPVFTTVAAKGLISESAPCAAGIFTGEGKDLAPETRILPESDLVVGIGLRVVEVLSPRLPAGPRLLLDEAYASVSAGFGGESNAVEPGSKAYSVLFDALEEKAWGLEIVESALRHMRESIVTHDWLPPRCFHLLNEARFNHTLITDEGEFCTVAEHVWTGSPERPYLGTANSRAVGTAIPTAVGVAVARRKPPVVCAVGDSGLPMHVAEIKTAVEHSLPILILFLTDGRYGGIAARSADRPRSERALTVPRPSWARAITAMGCDAEIVRDEEDFVARVAAWTRRGPFFLELPFEPKSYSRMARGLR